MAAAHQLLGIQFPHLQGLQSTLHSQTGQFQPVIESGFVAEGRLYRFVAIILLYLYYVENLLPNINFVHTKNVTNV